MMAARKTKENNTRESRICEELDRLNSLLSISKDETSPKVKAAKRLIENVAFMAIHLQDLQSEINKNGCTEQYKNGENQFGLKKSAAFDAYTSTIKNYMAAIKQIIEIAPEGTDSDELSTFMVGK